jgi:sodium/potassium/calcium exchanger 6
MPQLHHCNFLFLTALAMSPRMTDGQSLTAPTASPSPSTSYNPQTICNLTNLTNQDDCCTCFHSTCALVRANCPLGTGGTNLFNYFDLQYCALNHLPSVSYFVLIFWVLIVFSLLGTTADNFFVVQLETLSAQLKLSPSTAAITLLALGNSSPDVFSDIAAVQGNSDFNLAIGELVGASMFLTCVVLSAVILYATAPTKEGTKKECKVDKTPIRDILSFFVVLSAILLFSMTEGRIDQIEAALLIGAYVVYVTCVIVYTKLYENPKKLHRRTSMFGSNSLPQQYSITSRNQGRSGSGSTLSQVSQTQTMQEALLSSGLATRLETGEMQLVPGRANDSDSDSDSDDDEEEVLIGIDWDADASTFEKVTFVLEYPFSILRWISIATADQQWSQRRRVLSAIAPMGMVTVVFLDFSSNWTGGTAYAGFFTPVYLYNMIGAFVVGVVLYLTSTNDALPRWNGFLVFMAFVATVAWLDLLGNECVAVLESVGTITGITESSVGHSILGVTVLAWANSIGDFISDTAVTRAGKPEMGVSAVFGSPMLTACLGIGISVLIGSSVNGKGFVTATLDDELLVSFVFLAISLLSSLTVIVVSNYTLPRWYAYFLLSVYLTYMVMSVLIVTHVLPTWLPEPISVDCPTL